jgi:hypothetical protein
MLTRLSTSEIELLVRSAPGFQHQSNDSNVNMDVNDQDISDEQSEHQSENSEHSEHADDGEDIGAVEEEGEGGEEVNCTDDKNHDNDWIPFGLFFGNGDGANDEK